MVSNIIGAQERFANIVYNPVIDKNILIWWIDNSVKARMLNPDGTFASAQLDIGGSANAEAAASRVDDSFIVPGTDGVIIKVPSQ